MLTGPEPAAVIRSEATPHSLAISRAVDPTISNITSPRVFPHRRPALVFGASGAMNYVGDVLSQEFLSMTRFVVEPAHGKSKEKVQKRKIKQAEIE